MVLQFEEKQDVCTVFYLYEKQGFKQFPSEYTRLVDNLERCNATERTHGSKISLFWKSNPTKMLNRDFIKFQIS